MQSNKIVVYTQRVEIIKSYNERRDCADQRIAKFINACGYLPIPMPNNAELVARLVEELSPAGIVLTGGNSIVKYGGDAQERDDTDNALIKLAVQKKIPLYGFCRGMQSILDFFDNELHNVAGHVSVRHIVFGDENEMEVNSYHNQACRTLKSDQLQAVMKSEDGIIEKIKHKSLPIIGTMWHPEREKPFCKIDIDTVKKLFGGVD